MNRGLCSSWHHMVSTLSTLLFLVGMMAEKSLGLDLPIFGTFQTMSGYDVELGTDSICWVSKGHHIDDDANAFAIKNNGTTNNKDGKSLTPWDNKLFKDFVLEGEIEMLTDCPTNMNITAFSPFLDDPDDDHRRMKYDSRSLLQTGVIHDFRVQFSFSLGGLGGDVIVSDMQGPVVGVQILACDASKVGLCTPFVHEHANKRLKAENKPTTAEDGEFHGWTHIHSPTQFVQVNATKSGVQYFDLSVPMRVNHPGLFSVVAAFEFFTMDSQRTETGDNAFDQTAKYYRYDVANTVWDERFIMFVDPPRILAVSKQVRIIIWFTIFLANLCMGFLLFELLRHRTNRIIQLSQGPFLIAFLLAAMSASTITFLLNPHNDTYCNLATPLLTLSFQFMYAVLIARLWRINEVISPLLKTSFRTKSSVVTRLFDSLYSFMSCACLIGKKLEKRKQRSTRNVRKAVTNRQLIVIIILIMSPQVILQICNLVFQPDKMELEFNGDFTVARHRCVNDGNNLSIARWSEYFLSLLIALLLFLAWQSRTLPSLFNETESVFRASLTSFIVVMVSSTLVVLNDTPTTSPDLEFSLIVMSVHVVTLTTTFRIILPKLTKVWKGEKVLVSNLVGEHRKSQEYKRKLSLDETATDTGKAASSFHLMTFGMFGASKRVVQQKSYQKGKNSNRNHVVDSNDVEEGKARPRRTSTLRFASSVQYKHSSIPELTDEGEEEESDKSETGSIIEESDKSETESIIEESDDDDNDCTHKNKQGSGKQQAVSEGALFIPCNDATAVAAAADAISDTFHEDPTQHNRRRPPPRGSIFFHHRPNTASIDAHRRWKPGTTDPIHISEDKAPSRRLLLRMVDAQHLLERTNRRIISGKVLYREEWELVRDACIELGAVFDSRVEFDWESPEPRSYFQSEHDIDASS